MTTIARRITGGVDTHLDVHVAAALDELGPSSVYRAFRPLHRVTGNLELTIPWTDIERLDGHRLSARLHRRSNGKRVFFAMLDPGWKRRPLTLAIRQHLEPPTAA